MRFAAAPLFLLCVSAQSQNSYMFCSYSVNSASINSGAIADVYTNAGALQETGSYSNYQDCRA